MKDIHIMSYTGNLKEVGGGINQYIEYLEKYTHKKIIIDTINTKIISNLAKKMLYHQKMTNSMLKVPIVSYNAR